jgi:hypothetical protein
MHPYENSPRILSYVFFCLENKIREGFYSRILAELGTRKDRDIRDGIRMLQLVHFAYHPLRLQEHRHALAIPDEISTEFPCSDESFERD